MKIETPPKADVLITNSENKPTLTVAIPSISYDRFFQGMSNKSRERLAELVSTGKYKYVTYATLEGVLEDTSEEERELVIEGIFFEQELVKGDYIFYTDHKYPGYAKEYYKLIGRASTVKRDLEKKVQDIFPGVPEKEAVIKRVAEIFDIRLLRILKDSNELINKLDEKMEWLDFEHEAYEESLMSNLFMIDVYEDRGETVPEHILSEEEIVSRVDNPDEGTFLPRDKDKLLMEKILDQVKVLNDELKSIDVELYLFVSAFKILKDSGYQISLEDIKGVESKSFSSEQLLDVNKEQMRRIYEVNYAKTPNLQKNLLSSFDKALSSSDSNQSFFVFKHEGDVRGFYRLEETSPGHLYFGAFNVDPTYRGSRFGEAILTESLSKSASGSVVEGDCDREAPISSFYIENGFVGTGVSQFEEAAAMHIVKNKTAHDTLFNTTALSREQIILQSAVGEKREDRGIVFAAYPTSQIKSLPFELLNEVGGDGSRYVLTRYLREKNEASEVVYTAFEKISGEDFEKLMTPAEQAEATQSQA